MKTTKHLIVIHFIFYLNILLLTFTNCDNFTLGYITGSQRRVGNLQYTRPGIRISGAITLAINEVNQGKLKEMGHQLNFIVAETYGEEVTSIRQIANLWTEQISAYIGPQETCVHEGRMAAAFNLPMISYFCTHRETSDKRYFPTFARTRPPDTQISKSVVSLLLAFNWTHVTFLYYGNENTEFVPVAHTVLATLRDYGIHVNRVLTWNETYHHGYTSNPFSSIVEETYMDTRIYVILGQYYEHIGLLSSLMGKNLFDNGEYFVVGVDLELYDSSNPGNYMKGVLFNKDEKDLEKIKEAFRSYLAIFPSEQIAFNNFEEQVNKYMELPPFNFPNPLGKFGAVKKIRSEAAFLYDSVHLYAKALIKILEDGENPRNGTAIINALKGTSYLSAMGYHVYIDENGDAAGNYTILNRQPLPRNMSDINGKEDYGLYPIGTFSAPKDKRLPDVYLFKEIVWKRRKGPPVAEPLCGFRGEKCISYTGEITAGIAGGALLILGIVSLVLYRNWRYEQELDSLLWKIDYRDIQMHDNEKESSGQKLTRATHPLIKTSQVSLSSNPDADFRYSTIFTPIGVYKGQLYAIKKIRKKSVDITREMKKELKMLRDLRHDNICAFIGACTEPPNICIITEYCNKGSLKDVLENEDVKLDNMFIASMVADIIRGLIYLHDSPLRCHGSLNVSNCLIDSRWVIKLSDFGLNAFKQGSDELTGDIDSLKLKCYKLLYRAPELLRLGPVNLVSGTQKGDIYSFGIILYEIHTRHGPFGDMDVSVMDCLKKILHPVDPTLPFRPPLESLETCFDCVRECLKECWAEKPEDRPDLKTIRIKLRPLRKGMRPNIFDNMMAMMEKYANNLEALVDERTDQLQEEKKKTDALLLEMLPRPVAEQLKKGHKVEAESYDMVTIYFSDIVGFTALSAKSTPLQIVDFLNDLYTCFDSTIGHYDVYKVETIGDAYMVVSGLPIRNNILHAAEIASMSIHLLDAVSEFKIRHLPDQKLLLRIGIHSGPVCAGVVGLKMPRYCLFGDTVNTASRLESTGTALKIHISQQCKDLLDELGGYYSEERGLVSMKGKGDQRTYWLIGEDPEAREQRYRERVERRGSRAANRLHNTKNNNIFGDDGMRSSLKNRGIMIPRSALPRSSSFESPKKLRFASGSLLEHHRYHRYSDDALFEVISNASPRKSSGASFACEDFTNSCPIIDNLGDNGSMRVNFDSVHMNSMITADTPLLLESRINGII